MLSVLIPIFNFDVTDSIQRLAKQAKSSNISFEILCIDDCSHERHKARNRSISKIEGVEYKELKQNIGRSKIRNLLAQEAQYEHLLFLDCDIRIDKANFLSSYLKYAHKGQLVCGGVSYDRKKPKKDEQLRWHYGRMREEKSASSRSLSPYQSFTSCNMFLPKGIMKIHPFNEQLTEYGHEDTLLGIELKKAQVPVIHINNPIIHLGLDHTIDFLEKTVLSLENLRSLIKEGRIDKDVKLYRYYRLLKASSLLFRPIFKELNRWTKKALMKGSHSLFFFDLFKLTYLLKKS